LEHLEARLGLRATVSAAAPDRHSRVYLDRSYLEVAAQPGICDWIATHFFVRFEDPQWLRGHLASAGLASRFGTYAGVDGVWDDVGIEREPSILFPILVRRTHPPEVAADWPPTLTEIHPCGAWVLAAVYVDVPDWDPAVDVYTRLLGSDSTGVPVSVDGRRSLRLALRSGAIVLNEAPMAGMALVLGVRSLGETERLLPGSFRTDADRVSWLDPAAVFGVRLGFVEVGR
jgi:hypothetical protein